MSSFIIESAIFQESKIINNDPSKAIFRSVVQTADDINQNNRLYPKKVLDDGMEGCRSRMKRRAFLSELDHPVSIGNDHFDTVRQTTVSLEKVSHLIRDWEWKGNDMVAEMETLSTPNGRILLGLLKDKSGIGFSLRGLAELERGEKYNTVKGPLSILSYDCVSNPSHIGACVKDFNEMTFESHMLIENTSTICINGKCFLPNYFDQLIENKSINFFQRWI